MQADTTNVWDLTRSIQLLIVGEQMMADKVPTKYISNILGIGNKFERTKNGALGYAAVNRDDRRLSAVDKEWLWAICQIGFEPLQRSWINRKATVEDIEQSLVINRVKRAAPTPLHWLKVPWRIDYKLASSWFTNIFMARFREFWLNSASEAYSYCWTRIGNPTLAIKWYHFQPPRTITHDLGSGFHFWN